MPMPASAAPAAAMPRGRDAVRRSDESVATAAAVITPIAGGDSGATVPTNVSTCAARAAAARVPVGISSESTIGLSGTGCGGSVGARSVRSRSTSSSSISARTLATGTVVNASRAASRRAVCMASALGQRFVFSNASARSMTSLMPFGIAGIKLATERARPVVAAFTRSCCVLSASWTSFPVARVNIVAPTAQTSVCASISSVFAIACSGAMNAGVPMTMPVWVVCAPAMSRRRAMPKSSTLS